MMFMEFPTRFAQADLCLLSRMPKDTPWRVLGVGLWHDVLHPFWIHDDGARLVNPVDELLRLVDQ